MIKRLLAPARKEVARPRQTWRGALAIGLCLSLLAFFGVCASLSSPVALASTHLSPRRSLASSPSQGPVGAIITATGSGLPYPNGTSVKLGYTTDFSNCNTPPSSQPGVIHDGAFAGWLVWPASTGTGTFAVCGVVNGSNAFLIGGYQVLTATPPQVVVAPTTLDAGKQASVTGQSFLPAGTSVRLIWRANSGGPAVLLATVSSDATGAFTQNFTVPAHASTGSYALTALGGGGSPAALNASTTFHVNGITIVAVPTPSVPTKPTPPPALSPTVAVTTTAHATNTNTPANIAGGSNTSSGSGLVLPIALIGLLLIVAASIAGIFVVRRQRALAAQALAAPPAGPMWPDAPGPARPPAGMFTQGAGAPYINAGTLPPPGDSGSGGARSPRPVAAPATREAAPIPFDPGLAEAMRQAQVSLFATPRPLVAVGEEVPS